MNFEIKRNSDVEKFQQVSSAVLENDGYCPCMIVKDESTKCVCEEFLNQPYTGLCRCGRYEKLEIFI